MFRDKSAVEILKAFSRLDLYDWHGLCQHTVLDHARRVFDVDDEFCGSSKLGTQRNQAKWYAVSCDGFPEGLRIWTAENEIVLIDAPGPDLPGGLDTLLVALGSPQAKLDSYVGTLQIKQSEWVFPERGITVYLNPDNQVLLRIAVYGPVSLSKYEQTLRLNLKKSRLPLNRYRCEKESQ